MNNTSQTLKVFLACALGAFVGTLVALQLNQIFWFAGLIVGFSIGYLAYESKKIVAAIPIAWQRTTSWRPDWGFWKNIAQGFPGGYGVATTALIALMAMGAVGGVFLSGNLPSTRELLRAVCWFGGVDFFVGLIYSLLFFTDPKVREVMAPFSNPFRVYLWKMPIAVFKGTALAFKGIGWLVMNSPRADAPTVNGFKSVGRFFKNLFDAVHSDIRLLCGVDAAIGAVVGYYFANALIGALVGGLWGVFNFEVLSIRVRKLVPIDQSLFRW